MQYPRQTFIPRVQPPGYQLLPEQRLLFGVMGVLGAVFALALLAGAIIVIYMLLKTYI